MDYEIVTVRSGKGGVSSSTPYHYCKQGDKETLCGNVWVRERTPSHQRYSSYNWQAKPNTEETLAYEVALKRKACKTCERIKQTQVAADSRLVAGPNNTYLTPKQEQDRAVEEARLARWQANAKTWFADTSDDGGLHG